MPKNKRTTVEIDPALEAKARTVTKDDLPSLLGYEGVALYCSEELGVKISPRYVRESVRRGELRSSIIAKRLRFTPNDARVWVLDHN